MSTKKRVYIPKNKTNGQIKGKRKIWVENVKFLTLEEYDQLRETIKLHSRPELVNRNLLLIAIALNNGLRASDVVTLRVGHVLNKTKTRVIEQKTGKAKTLFWNNCLAEIIDYLNDLNYKDENAIFRCMAFTRCCNEWLEKRKIIKSLLRLEHTLLEKLLVDNSIRKVLTLKSFRSYLITPLNEIRATI